MQFILADSKLIRESSNVLSEEYPTFFPPRVSTDASVHRKVRSDRAATVLLCSMLDRYGVSNTG